MDSGLIELFGPVFYTSCVLFFLAIMISMAEMLLYTFSVTEQLPKGFHIELLIDAVNSDMVISFVPIASTIPFAGSYVDDIKNKFARIFLIRSSYRTYIGGRIVVGFVAGGVTVLFGLLVAWGIMAVAIMPLEEKNEEVIITAIVRLIEICFLLFMNGGFWSVVGMAMSTLVESKYISYAAPFVCYYLLVILYERYFPDFFIIYPKIWIDPAAWPYGCWGAITFLVEITLIFIFLFSFRAKRRLRQL